MSERVPMGFLTNLRLRRKLLIAMVPLVLMVVVAGIYSSFESNMIDNWYSVLIDTQVKALRTVGEARAHTNRFGLFLYELVDEPDSNRRQVLDGQLEKVGADYHTAMTTALQQSPDRADKINEASALFEQAEADARPIRAAALVGNRVKASDLLRAAQARNCRGHVRPRSRSCRICKNRLINARTQARHASEPGKVLAGLNQALCGKFQHNFVTAAYVYVDLEKSFMNYAGAGHPPLLLWRKSTGSASQLLENGLVMGQFEEATYDSLRVPVEHGDRFVLYTDGILETCNPTQEEFGTNRFMQFMETNNQLTAGPFADALLLELACWLEQPPGEGHKDDISLLAIDVMAR
jgi:Stage II sporulation protein E (SpoIIE)